MFGDNDVGEAAEHCMERMVALLGGYVALVLTSDYEVAYIGVAMRRLSAFLDLLSKHAMGDAFTSTLSPAAG